MKKKQKKKKEQENSGGSRGVATGTPPQWSTMILSLSQFVSECLNNAQIARESINNPNIVSSALKRALGQDQAFCQWFSLTNFISYWNPCIWLAERNLSVKFFGNASQLVVSVRAHFCAPPSPPPPPNKNGNPGSAPGGKRRRRPLPTSVKKLLKSSTDFCRRHATNSSLLLVLQFMSAPNLKARSEPTSADLNPHCAVAVPLCMWWKAQCNVCQNMSFLIDSCYLKTS